MIPKLDADGDEVLDEDGEPVLEPVYDESPGLELSKRFEPIEVRARGRIPVGRQPAVRLSREAEGRERRTVRRARQDGVPGARLPGLPPAQGFPRGQIDAGARPVAHRRQAHRPRPARNGCTAGCASRSTIMRGR